MPDASDVITGTGMVDDLGYHLNVIVTDEGIFADNFNLKFKKPIFIDWQKVSVIDVRPSKTNNDLRYAKLLMSNPKEITEHLFLPWSDSFRNTVPKSVGFSG